MQPGGPEWDLGGGTGPVWDLGVLDGDGGVPGALCAADGVLAGDGVRAARQAGKALSTGRSGKHGCKSASGSWRLITALGASCARRCTPAPCPGVRRGLGGRMRPPGFGGQGLPARSASHASRPRGAREAGTGCSRSPSRPWPLHPPPHRHLDTHAVSCVGAQGRLYLQLSTAPSPSVRVHAQGRRACGRGRTWGLGEGDGRLALALPCWWSPPRGRGRMAAVPATRSRSGFAIHAVGSTSWACPRAPRRRFLYAARPLAAAERAGSGPQHHSPPVPPAAFTSAPHQSPQAPALAPLTWCSSGWTCTAPRSSAPSAGSPPR